ncbi:D-arabinono-1,4-lactone oxidase [Halorientalis pallida]|uniref:FAD-binding protein n=1 Tax=Halorientalis pallida TaxID=2479928 RepID=A0A498L431_9EURY|nr:D-arabinono-1,4-lactone oxidase [Halorientalis pallida]RXK51384.1 FAD-binding protein [Halorientalis pallida]
MSSEWRNWAGTASCHPQQWETPASEEELRELVAGLGPGAGTLRVAGSAHSFPPVVPSGDVLVTLENYSGIVDVDEAAQQVTVRAGTPLSHLSSELAAYGLAMENLGDIDHQTVAGAISTGTHGTGSDLGILSTQVARMGLITADGTVVECSPDERPDLFRAAQVSLGALGVISTVTLDVVPAYDLELRTRPMPLDACLDRLPELRSENRHFEFFWFPHTETAFVKTMNRTDADRTGPGGDFDSKVENLAWEVLCRLSTRFPSTAPYATRAAAWSFSSDRAVGPSHELFAHDRTVRFAESEWSIPADEITPAIRELKAWIERHDEPVTFPVEVRYTAGDDIPLSPAYGRESGFVAVHKYHRKPHHRYFEAVASILRERGGRPHWGKLHSLDGTDVPALYPEWNTFRRVREACDPGRLFLNDHLDRLFGQ